MTDPENNGYDSPGYVNTSYSNGSSGYGNSGYSQNPEVRQGNFSDGYRENIYDPYNLGDTAYTDSAANPNPEL